MYDTIVLYLAVFPEVDPQKRYVRLIDFYDKLLQVQTSTEDPKWDRWTCGSQNNLLQAWAHRNLDVMFERIFG